MTFSWFCPATLFRLYLIKYASVILLLHSYAAPRSLYDVRVLYFPLPVNMDANTSRCFPTSSKVLAADQPDTFVYPWKGVLANIQRFPSGGQYIGPGSSKLRDMLSAKGLRPMKVHTLWDRKNGFSGFAIVEFEPTWVGFNNALAFEKTFEVEGHGKHQFYSSHERGSSLFGWMARDDDYNSATIFAERLRKMADLRTLAELESEEGRKAALLLESLRDQVQPTDNHTKQTVQRRFRHIPPFLSLFHLCRQWRLRQKSTPAKP